MFKRNMQTRAMVKRIIGLSLSLAMVLSLTFTGKVNAEDDVFTTDEFYEEIDNYFNESTDMSNDYSDYQNQNDTDFIEGDSTYYDEHNGFDDYYDYQDGYNFEDFESHDDDYNWVDDFTIPDDTPDYNYDYYSYDDFDFGVFEYMPYSEEDFFFMDDYFEEFEEEEHIPGEKFLKTPKTIQYTFDKNNQYPKYIDTGISVSDEAGIDGDMLKELFRQISIRKNIKIVEDINRVMALLDGKLVVVEGSVTDGETLEKLFEETSVKVKIQPTRVGGKFNLADYLEYKGEILVEVNGEKINLISDPVIENSRVLFPIRSIGEAMGADVKWDKEKQEAIVKKDNKTIVFKADSDIVTVDGVEYLISNKTHLNTKEDRILSVLNLLVNELDGEMYWDRTNSILKIETAQEEINPDADFR